MESTKAFKTFEDLEAYQAACEFRKAMYAVTRQLPDYKQYLPTNEVANLKEQGWRVYRLLNGYLRYLRERKAGASLELHESSPAYGLTEDELDAALSDEPRFNDSTFQPFNKP